MKRRALLSSTLLGVASLSGCSSILGDGTEGIRIQQIDVSNVDDRAHTIGVQVEDSDGVVVDEQYELDPLTTENGYEIADGVDVDLGDVEGEHADYTVRATLESGPADELQLTDVLDTDCADLLISINREGGVAILVGGC